MFKPSFSVLGKRQRFSTTAIRFLGLALMFGLVCQVSAKEDTPDRLRRPAIELTPYRFEGQPEQFLKGSYEVYEDREALSGRKISIQVMVAPALEPDPLPDPLFLFVGGPGQGAADVALYLARNYKLINSRRDLVMIDQRGTGASNPLDCKPLGPEDQVQTYLGEMFPLEFVQQCREELEKRADLGLYTTDIAMDDIDEIRAALGYEKINLSGGSYGTRAALVYLRRHPESVRAVYIHGVAPTSMAIPGSFAGDAEAAMRALFKDCEADSACNQAYPNFRRQFQEVLDKITEEAVSLNLENPFTKQPETVRLGRAPFITGIRAMLYSTRGASRIPRIVSQCAAGDFEPLTQFVAQYGRGISQGLTNGMYLSVTCAEDVPFIDRKKAFAAAEGTFLGAYRLEQQIGACENWPAKAVARAFLEPVKSDVPVLIISGAVDPVTPPRWGEAAAKHLPNSLHVSVPNASHGMGGPWGDCLQPLVVDFLNRGTVEGLDVSCLAKTKRPPFLVAEKE